MDAWPDSVAGKDDMLGMVVSAIAVCLSVRHAYAYDSG
jgi:hypothetical protein